MSLCCPICEADSRGCKCSPTENKKDERLQPKYRAGNIVSLDKNNLTETMKIIGMDIISSQGYRYHGIHYYGHKVSRMESKLFPATQKQLEAWANNEGQRNY